MGLRAKARFISFYLLVIVIAFASVLAFFRMATKDIRIEERVVSPPSLSSKSSFTEVMSRFGDPLSVNTADGMTCYQWSDNRSWIAQVCKPAS